MGCVARLPRVVEDLERAMLAALTPAQIATFRLALESGLAALNDPTL